MLSYKHCLCAVRHVFVVEWVYVFVSGKGCRISICRLTFFSLPDPQQGPTTPLSLSSPPRFRRRPSLWILPLNSSSRHLSLPNTSLPNGNVNRYSPRPAAQNEPLRINTRALVLYDLRMIFSLSTNSPFTRRVTPKCNFHQVVNFLSYVLWGRKVVVSVGKVFQLYLKTSCMCSPTHEQSEASSDHSILWAQKCSHIY